MNNVQIFNNSEFGEIRTVVIDGEPWFVGNDVVKPLGYVAPRNAIARFVDDEDRKTHQFDASGQARDMIIINESGLYSLIFGSKLESAKKFKKWVTSEVLPTIRKTGSYGQQRPMTITEQIQLIAQGHVELEQKIESVKADLEDFKNDLPLLGVEETRITTAVRKKGIECLGGKDSNAYNDKCLRQKLYSDLHRQIRREFGLSTYKALKRNQTDMAIAMIQNYVPPHVLSETIDTVNAQQILDV